jgi:hypothetical protein
MISTSSAIMSLMQPWNHVKPSNDGLQLRRAIGIQAEGIRVLDENATAPSAARLCWVPPLEFT